MGLPKDVSVIAWGLSLERWVRCLRVLLDLTAANNLLWKKLLYVWYMLSFYKSEFHMKYIFASSVDPKNIILCDNIFPQNSFITLIHRCTFIFTNISCRTGTALKVLIKMFIVGVLLQYFEITFCTGQVWCDVFLFFTSVFKANDDSIRNWQHSWAVWTESQSTDDLRQSHLPDRQINICWQDSYVCLFNFLHFESASVALTSLVVDYIATVLWNI